MANRKPLVIANGTVQELPAGDVLMGTGASFRNRIINGGCENNQRGVVSAADDAYVGDRFYVLTESGTVTFTHVADPESGAPYGYRITQPDATAKRMGFAQIIEGRYIRPYALQAMNMSARIKLSSGASVRYAVIEHTGTEDVVTSDVVNNWASTNFTAGNFFISGVNILKTGSVTPGASTFGDVSDWVALGSGVKNVILFMWTESTMAQSGSLEFNRWAFEPGTIKTPFEWRMNELALCQRYYYRVKPGAGQPLAFGVNYGTTNSRFVVTFPVTMRVAPTSLEQSGNAAHYVIAQSGIGNTALSSVPVFSVATQELATLTGIVASGLTAFNPATLSADVTNGAGAFLGWSAEL